MATQRRRSSRAALVACAPSLARIHERVFEALGLPAPADNAEYGKPGGGYLPAINLSGVKDRDYQSINMAARHYFSAEWLSKLDDGLSCKSKAVEAYNRFEEAESSCGRTNHAIRLWAKSPWWPTIQSAIQFANSVLGPFNWDEAAKSFGWGPGSTTRLTRRKADAAHKYSGNPHSTIGNAILGNTVIQWSPCWARTLAQLPEDEGVGYVKIVPGNRVVTVPKNYKTDRTIAIEPDMNIYVQLGLGNYIRKRLLRKGVNLNDQTTNQNLARVGSMYGGLATIDLSMASDMISRNLVELLIRPDWLSALGQSRSPYGVLPSGEKIFYQKFSSMGNGYTFELESLIFFSLAKAYDAHFGEGDGTVSVYGDDIILPCTHARGFMDLLEFVGFKPNDKKSHTRGHFRESCGKHYLFGCDITPFYVKRAPTGLLDLFKIHNQLWRYIDRGQFQWMTEDQVNKLRDVCRWLRGFAPAKWRRPTVVDGIGDGGFVGYLDEINPSRAPFGWDGYNFRSLISTPVIDSSHDGDGLLTKALASLERSSTLDLVRAALLGFEPSSDSVVFPIKGVRVRAGKVFVPTRILNELSTGLYAR